MRSLIAWLFVALFAGPLIAADKATLFEEGLDGPATTPAQFSATVDWHFNSAGDYGPEAVATIDVPERGMTIRLSTHRNEDETLPATHLIEIVVAGAYGKRSVASIPRLVAKSSEQERGSALHGAAVAVGGGLFWDALSPGGPTEKRNLALLRDGAWFDLPMVYQDGRRAILTFPKGESGEKVMDQALAAWTPGPPEPNVLSLTDDVLHLHPRSCSVAAGCDLITVRCDGGRVTVDAGGLYLYEIMDWMRLGLTLKVAGLEVDVPLAFAAITKGASDGYWVASFSGHAVDMARLSATTKDELSFVSEAQTISVSLDTENRQALEHFSEICPR